MRKINYHFESTEVGRYLAIEIGEKQRPVWHQIEMVSNNSECNLISPIYMEKGDKCFFSYKIEKQCSFSEFASKNEVDAIEFTEFIHEILVQMFLCEDYLLDKSSFILNADLIFIDKELKKFSLIYFPCKNSIEINAEMREFLSDLITTRIRFSQGGELAVATLLNYYKSHDFNLLALASICDSLIRQNVGANSFDAPVGAPITHYPPLTGTPPLTETPPYEARLTKNTSEKEAKPNSLALKVQPIFVVFAIILLITPISTYVNFLGPNPRPIMFLILAGIDLVVLFFLRGESHTKKGGATSIDKQEHTMLLSNIRMKFGYLVEKNIPNGVRFELNSLIIIVGREKEEVDLFCENMAVGKRHAQLHFHDGSYYISDLNSKNGTFVNGVRIEGIKEKQIKPGDEIYFANSGFVFEK